MNDKDNKLIYENYISSGTTVNESGPEDWTRWSSMTPKALILMLGNIDINRVEDLGESIEETTYEQYKILMMSKTPTPLQTLWKKFVHNVQKYSDMEVTGYAKEQETFDRAREDLYQMIFDLAREGNIT